MTQKTKQKATAGTHANVAFTVFNWLTKYDS